MIGPRTMHLAHIPDIVKKKEITPRNPKKKELCYHCKEPWKRGHKYRRELKSYRDELKGKKLFFQCKESWELGHTCGKRIQVKKMDATLDEETKDKVNKRPKYNQESNENAKDR